MVKKKKMTERQLAEEVQRRRGDISGWSRRSTPAENKKETAIVFSVRFSPSELDGIRKQADDLGVTVASVIRGAVLDHSANQSVVYDFARLSNPPPLTILGNAVVPFKASCQWREQGLPGYSGYFVVPPHGTVSAFSPANETDDKRHKEPVFVLQ